MFSEFFQFSFSGITLGAIYALVALGFTLIYNASHVINFAQGEFLMIGGMGTVVLMDAGAPIYLAIPGAIVMAGIAGVLLHKLAIAPAKNADVVTLIIITIGASIFLRGLAQIFWGKDYHALPAFSDTESLSVGGAVLLTQSLWILGIAALLVTALGLFFTRTALGKALLATSMNKDAASMVGIKTGAILTLAFGIAALLGAVAGVIVAPITFTAYDIGIMLGLKGFIAAAIGGLGSSTGAILGGLLLGLAEAYTAGYISSDYKDAVPFVLILVILFFLPNGLLGSRAVERV
ncbi:MAG: branched-chain amino acid ABC transporter permease [Alloalcanivorax venustensis]|jgi:branched-chain amino acid transport system permease protein|uniref:branched-chain amino acid ABC transporter permease n=1 Tax=Alloalcanivorax venustensis TaxID=172371 RepID=UPI000C58D92C|nr:branched-chain amino acid ABC transporter permease [Alcanivorax sp.]MCH2550699.1 branched-chain amino acid ABC transporter permease [Alcanivorax sp.]QVL43468.1 MAG: branched-chain amino acid ABC transporter permease [Alcanivorax sp.]HAM75062.1 branched-chain amino acid ABC transporter permease [Alcanivorax sp.]|tara:strand:- start:4343 stop:5218 length:876 start_codon:yes stop_codon:yes gene_type:complete